MVGLCFALFPPSTIADIQNINVETLKIKYNDIAQPNPSYKVTAKGIIDCSRQCLNSETCLSVLYKREMRDCSLNTQQVLFQYDAVIPSLSASHVLIPLRTVGTVGVCLLVSLPIHFQHIPVISRRSVILYQWSSTGFWERSGSVVECLTWDREGAGSSLTGVTALWSLSKTHLS